MRAMHRASCDVCKEWFVWLRCFLHSHPRDCFIRNVFSHVIVIATFIGHHGRRLVKHRWFPLRCFCIQDAVKAFETETCRPTIKRPRKSLFPEWGQVPLAECSSGISGLLQDFSNTRCFFRNNAVVARENICAFRYAAHVHCVVVTPGQHCCARW